MIIDRLLELRRFSDYDFLLSAVFYLLAAIPPILLRSWGLVRAANKEEKQTSFRKELVQHLPASVFSLGFFALTGCLRAPLAERTSDPEKNKRLFLGGFLFLLYGAIGSFLLFTILQFLSSRFSAYLLQLATFFTEALTTAHLSALLFSLLPIPESDALALLRKKPLGKTASAILENQTISFFTFCVIALLLSCITVPVGGSEISLMGLLVRYPFLLLSI